MFEGAVLTEADDLTPIEAVNLPIDASVLNDFTAVGSEAGASETRTHKLYKVATILWRGRPSEEK